MLKTQMKQHKQVEQYLEVLELQLKNNIAEMQLALKTITEISNNLLNQQNDKSIKSSQILDAPPTCKLSKKPPKSLLRIQEVCLILGISRSTLYRMVNDGQFPKALDLGPRYKAWQKSTVTEWIRASDN